MKILFDTNEILDIMLDREPFSEPAAIPLSKVDQSDARRILMISRTPYCMNLRCTLAWIT